MTATALSSDDLARAAIESRLAMQKPRELAAFIDIIRGRPIRNVLEIGGMHGGTMWVWSQFATGKLLCVDAFVLSGRMEQAHDVAFTLVEADSTRRATRHQVLELLDGEAVDLLFVDGDHTSEAVRADARNWLPLLAPAGVAGFHDICHRSTAEHDMWRFWLEIRDVCGDRCYEVYDAELKGHWGGIGVLLGPAAAPIQAGGSVYAGNLRAPAQTLEES
jgi:predicted O-methyltransferase YrrM